MPGHTIMTLLLLGITGAVAGGTFMGWRAHKKIQTTKKFSKKQKREMNG